MKLYFLRFCPDCPPSLGHKGIVTSSYERGESRGKRKEYDISPSNFDVSRRNRTLRQAKDPEAIQGGAFLRVTCVQVVDEGPVVQDLRTSQLSQGSSPRMVQYHKNGPSGTHIFICRSIHLGSIEDAMNQLSNNAINTADH